MQKCKKPGVFEITKQQLCDQARAIGKNCWLGKAESEIVNRSIEDVKENQTEEHSKNK